VILLSVVKKLTRDIDDFLKRSYEENLLGLAKQQKATAQTMMKYLVLVAAWDGPNLADSLFSAIGTRVVELVHEPSTEQVKHEKSVSISLSESSHPQQV